MGAIDRRSKAEERVVLVALPEGLRRPLVPGLIGCTYVVMTRFAIRYARSSLMEETRTRCVRRLLAEADLIAMAKILTRYASGRIRYYSAFRKGQLSGAKEPVDFAYEAIEDTYSGVRNWDPEKEPDLELFLKGVVNSKVRNWVARREGGNYSLDALVDEPFKSAEECEFLMDLEKEFSEDQDLWPIVHLFSEGMTKPADVAHEMGITVEELQNRRKRLRRRVEKMMLGPEKREVTA